MCTKSQVFFLLCLLTFIGFTTSDDTVFCDNTAGNFTENDTYGRNRDLILSSLSFKVSANSGFFYNGTAGEDPDKVYAIGFCREDYSSDGCKLCMESAFRNIQFTCPNQKEAVAWIGDGPCIVRYASHSFFGILKLDTWPYSGYNTGDISSSLTQFHKIWGNLMADVMERASYGTGRRLVREEANLTSVQSIYTLMQCTPDLSESDCHSCLNRSVSYFQMNYYGSQGGFVQRSNCIWRWDLYRFYELPLNSTRSTPKKGKLGIAHPAIIITITVFVILVVIACILLYMKKNPKYNANSLKVLLFKLRRGIFGNFLQNKDFHGEKMGISQEFPSMQLGDIKAATQHFNDANKLGEGGFGPVYKGTLADGRVVAVKRLSRTSGQGLVEFKNEVMLIAKLQHKNLVKLLGCCLEKKEKLLVYEFMPNRSLDVFLFDSNKSMKLDWQRRLNIINGLARGIMYLHEDSRLKIIHRDLKASNILLDGKMNPKISDFGMARIFRGNQNEANTNRVVGTYGYMAPEYAMNGLFSTKSDVFSFGVLLLEIISGKMSNGFHHLEDGESLLSYAWKLWCKDEWMKLIDPAMVKSCVASEVRKCIHIGLLCVPEVPADRPSMSSLVLMLTSENMALPKPKEPAFSVGRVGAGIRSFNNVTISDVSPR